VIDTLAGLSILFSSIIGFICLELKIIKPELLLLSSPPGFLVTFILSSGQGSFRARYSLPTLWDSPILVSDYIILAYFFSLLL